MNASPAPRSRPGLPRTVYALGFVSFATDLGSEMVVPLLPALLAGLGAGMTWLGLLQGLGELLVALCRIGSGWLSDRSRRRKPWLVAGYGLSTLMRPLFAFAGAPWHALLLRSVDRVGKGVRSAPRDALLADSVPADRRGEAFGVQRAMDHAGALGGALVAAGLLTLGAPLSTVFLLSLFPGLLAMGVLLLAVPERDHVVAPERAVAGSLRSLVPFLVVVLLGGLGAAVDLFVLARASELGAPPAALPLLWALLHVVRAGLARPLGALSDRLGRVRGIAAGLLVHAAVMLGFAAAAHAWLLVPLFLLHGLHAAFTEGAERGYVVDTIGSARRGLGFGVFYAVQGVAALAGSLLLGLLWDAHGSAVAFAAAAAASLLARVALVAVPTKRRAG